MKKQLTATLVANMTPPTAGRLEVFDTIVSSLALRVTPNGARSFVVRARIRGQAQPVTLTLGDATAMKLADARRAASDAMQQMKLGNDPREAKKAETARYADAALTFDALIDEWSALHLAHRSPRYRYDVTRTLRRDLAGLLGTPAGAVKKSDVVNAVDKLVLAGKPVEARNLIAYGRACYSWARKRGKVEVNPFADLPMVPPRAERDRVLEDSELSAIWGATAATPYPFGPFWQLLILTLQREDSVARMQWSEISEGLSVWRIPGAHMKGGVPHFVHLAAPAQEILAALPRISDFVFTTTGDTPISGISKATTALRKKAGIVEHWVPHDFRRTGVTVLARLGFDSIVVDRLLAHQPAKLRGVAGVYQRHDFARERAVALDAWAAHVTGRNDGDNVAMLPLRKAR